MYKTIFVINTRVCNILMFCKFEIAVYLSFMGRICSPKEFTPLTILNLLERICSLKNFLYVYVYIDKLFSPFRTL